jgi:hypothetical protein
MSCGNAPTAIPTVALVSQTRFFQGSSWEAATALANAAARSSGHGGCGARPSRVASRPESALCHRPVAGRLQPCTGDRMPWSRMPTSATWVAPASSMSSHVTGPPEEQVLAALRALSTEIDLLDHVAADRRHHDGHRWPGTGGVRPPGRRPAGAAPTAHRTDGQDRRARPRGVRQARPLDAGEPGGMRRRPADRPGRGPGADELESASGAERAPCPAAEPRSPGVRHPDTAAWPPHGWLARRGRSSERGA